MGMGYNIEYNRVNDIIIYHFLKAVNKNFLLSLLMYLINTRNRCIHFMYIIVYYPLEVIDSDSYLLPTIRKGDTIHMITTNTNIINKVYVKVNSNLDIHIKEVEKVMVIEDINTSIINNNYNNMDKNTKKKRNRLQRLYEAYETVEELILSNIKQYTNTSGKLVKRPIVLTFTLSQGNKIDTCNDIKNVIRRIKKLTNNKQLHYVYVYGLQENREPIEEGLHIHMIIFNMDKIDINLLPKAS